MTEHPTKTSGETEPFMRYNAVGGAENPSSGEIMFYSDYLDVVAIKDAELAALRAENERLRADATLGRAMNAEITKAYDSGKPYLYVPELMEVAKAALQAAADAVKGE